MSAARTDEQVMADAADGHPFSNHTEFEMWAGSGRGCYDCTRDNPDTNLFCPILSVALLSKWPIEWTRRAVHWQIGGKSGAYDVVDTCTEFDQRPDNGGGDDDPDSEPKPPGPPTAELPGQVDMFEVFTDQIIEQVQQQVVTV